MTSTLTSLVCIIGFVLSATCDPLPDLRSEEEWEPRSIYVEQNDKPDLGLWGKRELSADPFLWGKRNAKVPYFIKKGTNELPYFIRKETAKVPYFLKKRTAKLPYFIKKGATEIPYYIKKEAAKVPYFIKKETKLDRLISSLVILREHINEVLKGLHVVEFKTKRQDDNFGGLWG